VRRQGVVGVAGCDASATQEDERAERLVDSSAERSGATRADGVLLDSSSLFLNFHPPDDVAGKLDWAGLTMFTVTSLPVSIDNDAIDWNALEVNYDGKKR
jgi:hypothetical protein